MMLSSDNNTTIDTTSNTNTTTNNDTNTNTNTNNNNSSSTTTSSSSSLVSSDNFLERMKSNNALPLTELRLTEAPEAYCRTITELIDTIQQSTNITKTIEYVCIDRDFIPCMDVLYVNDFFNALGSSLSSSLQEIHIWHAALSVQAIIGFLNHLQQTDSSNSSNLKYFELGCIELSGTTNDFHELSIALRAHTNLRVFHMVDFNLCSTNHNTDEEDYSNTEHHENDDNYSNTNTNNEKMNILVSEGLAQLQSLEIVKIEVTLRRRRSLVGGSRQAAAIQPQMNISGTAIASLITNAHQLKEIRFNRIHLSLDDIKQIAIALKKETTNTSTNNPSQLRCISLPHCDITDDGCHYLASTIAETSCQLHTIDFSCNKLTDEGCILLASALKGNTSVKMLRLWGNVKISNAGFDALLEMLEINCTLERVPLIVTDEYGTKIETALLKNRINNNNINNRAA